MPIVDPAIVVLFADNTMFTAKKTLTPTLTTYFAQKTSKSGVHLVFKNEG